MTTIINKNIILPFRYLFTVRINPPQHIRKNLQLSVESAIAPARAHRAAPVIPYSWYRTGVHLHRYISAEIFGLEDRYLKSALKPFLGLPARLNVLQVYIAKVSNETL